MAAIAGILATLFLVLAIACAIGHLVCFILVLIQMFKREQTGLGIACIVLTFCIGIGPLIGFIMGWVKSAEWDLKKIMLRWTGCIAGIFVCYALVIVFGLMAAAGAAQNLPNIDPADFKMDNIEFDMPIDE